MSKRSILSSGSAKMRSLSTTAHGLKALSCMDRSRVETLTRRVI
jgi:hypothetical protein